MIEFIRSVNGFIGFSYKSDRFKAVVYMSMTVIQLRCSLGYGTICQIET
ncbi:hypothetical protein ACSYAD_06970 [Acaryochloris marina NIES-2412]